MDKIIKSQTLLVEDLLYKEKMEVKYIDLF